MAAGVAAVATGTSLRHIDGERKALRGNRKRREERWSARRRAMIHLMQYAVVYW
jgi:hypothetical protein